MVDPFVSENLVDCGSLGGVIVENTCDEVTRGVRNGDVLREIVGIHANTLVGGLDIGGLEGRLTNDEGVNNNSEGPNIDLIGVTLLSFEDFGSNIIGSSANGSFALAVEL